MAQLLLLNPSKRGTRKMAKRKRKPRRTHLTKKSFKRKTPRRRRLKAVKRYRNPITYARPNPTRRKRVVRRARQNIVMQSAPAAVTAAIGALGSDVLLGYLTQYIPAELQTGPMAPLTRAASAIGLGLIIEKFAPVRNKRTLAKEVMIGGLTVTLHGVFKDLLVQSGANIPLGGMDAYSPAPVSNSVGYIDPAAAAY